MKSLLFIKHLLQTRSNYEVAESTFHSLSDSQNTFDSRPCCK